MKTAIEKFIEQLEKKGGSWENVSIGRIQISIKVEDYLELQRQAKEMEKQQIIDAHNSGYIDGEFFTAEQYYDDIFKQNN